MMIVSDDEGLIADLHGPEEHRGGHVRKSAHSTDSLSADLDEACTRVVKTAKTVRGGCAANVSASRRWFTNGASNLDDLIDWFPAAINKVEMMSNLPGRGENEDFVNNLKLNLAAKLVITESYAGAGVSGGPPSSPLPRPLPSPPLWLPPLRCASSSA